jgi:hypothetical protein
MGLLVGRRGFLHSEAVNCRECAAGSAGLTGAWRMKKKKLTIELLCQEATAFAEVESTYPEPTLYGVTDGKAIGTYLEHKFRAHLQVKYTFASSSSAAGVDFPDLQVDMKVTAITQPQSSCPFESARQKIFGLGYSVLVFVYEKQDDAKTTTAVLNILHTVVFV